MFKLFLANLDFETTTEDLSLIIKEHCAECVVDLPRDRRTGKGRGFAFVEAPTQEKQLDLLKKISASKIKGRMISVKQYTDNSRNKIARRDEVYNER